MKPADKELLPCPFCGGRRLPSPRRARMTDLAQLIAKLEAASEGSRELDGQIAVASGVHGPDLRRATLSVSGFINGDGVGGFGNPTVERYTTSIDAIVALIERSDWKLYSVDASIDGRPSCFIKGPDRVWPADDESDEHFGPGWEHGRAKSLPLALCIALLRALPAQQETSEDE